VSGQCEVIAKCERTPELPPTRRGSASHRRKRRKKGRTEYHHFAILNLLALSGGVKRRKQNHKISFHFLSGSPHTPRRKWIGKEIFGFGSRPEGARGAPRSLHRAIGAYGEVQSHHALGACVSRQNPADFAHTMFELRPKNTA
jgi:hypothetical protein